MDKKEKQKKGKVMHPLEKISTGTTREAGHQPDGTEYPAWSGQDGKNYGSERGCNFF